MAAPAFIQPQRTRRRCKWYSKLGDYKFVASLNQGQLSLAEYAAEQRLDEIVERLERLDDAGTLSEAAFRAAVDEAKAAAGDFPGAEIAVMGLRLPGLVPQAG